jgi:translocation and assembly module TamB
MRRAIIFFAFLALALALLAATVAWLGGREGTLQWAIKRLEAATGGTLQIEGAQGTFYGPLKIDRLIFENASQRIEARGIELDWEPQALARQLLHIKRIHIASLEIRGKQTNDEPAKFPSDLRLPIDIQIDDAKVHTLSIINDNKPALVLQDLAANAESRDGRHTINLTSVDSPWGSGNTRIELGADKPFPINATGHFTGRAPRAFTLTFKTGGSLEAIQLSANAAAQGGKALLEAKIRPLAKAPIQAFTLNAKDVDLHNIDADLPFTLLAVEANGSVGEKGEISANVAATNAAPGMIDEQRLPLKTFQGRLTGSLEKFTARNLSIDLGTAGQFTGDGARQNGRAEITLTTQNLNLLGIHSKLRETRAVGTLALVASGKNFSEQRLKADLNEKKLDMHLRLDASHAGNDVTISAAELTAAGGGLNANGHLGLAGKRPFKLVGKLARFNPAAFGKFPVASIGGDVRASGHLADPLQATAEFTLADSTLRGQPLSGKGTIELASKRITHIDVALNLAGNQLDATGAFGRPGDELAWRLDAANLAHLDPSLAGRARGSGTLLGSLDEPAAAFDLVGNELRLPGAIAIATLKANGNVNTSKNGVIDTHVVANGVKQGRLDLAQMKVDATGTRDKHTLQLSAQGPRGVDFIVTLIGGWIPKQGWSGQITELANRGVYNVELRAPASLAIGPGRFELRDAHLAVAEGSLDIEAISRASGKLSTQGTMSGLSVAYLQKLFPDQTRADDVKSTLTIGGRWSLEVGESINGNLRLAREAGDLTLLSEPLLSLGLNKLDFAADIVQNRVKAIFDLEGKTAGKFNARVETLLAQRNDAWGVPGDAPLVIEAAGDIPSLAWAGLFINPGYAIDGRARLRFSRTGTARAPQINGSLEGDALTLRVSEYGIHLRDGVLRANFEQNRIVLSQFRMRAEEGELTANGSLKLGQDGSDVVEGGADIRADKLFILNHPDYQLAVTGDGKLAFAGGKLAITGEVRADRGAIRLPDRNRPNLSDDVIVVGKPGVEMQKRGASPLSVDLQLDLGRDFKLRGHGIDASLRGKLHVKSAPPGLPIGTGVIRVADGTYEAYGQKLEIERGVLSFAGPIDNPSLDILAVRKKLEVEPGVSISGTARNPRVRLVSDPPVPDTEKLAWLVLGHGLEGSTGSEMELLPVAAAALLSSRGGGNPTGNIAKTIGLDEIGLSRNRTATTNGANLAEQGVLTIGKRISSKLYVTYETGLDAASRVVRLQYELSRRWSVRAETGTQSAFDLFYTLRFE